MGVLSGPLTGSRFLGKSYKAILEELEQDPCNYDEAINDIVSGRWLDAMKAEMESMYSNQVWTLVDLPANVKPIGCKWVDKRKSVTPQF